MEQETHVVLEHIHWQTGRYMRRLTVHMPEFEACPDGDLVVAALTIAEGNLKQKVRMCVPTVHNHTWESEPNYSGT